ncbi:glycosyltransferase family 4 protein [Streptomyces scopuliridis]|uniref:Glycosyltransferase family 4 protein n=1 Tax=Streptomyces scopuliridis TaxID=452529 RepID=A0ACD4ZCC9_9ACTN|nr:glycosyltransferase family 4 protein [Streptomyces scopuliridis]WSB95613.1 glycosyltransferase family 4 protein [Streptomyces scopuliridis]WSC10678.1 glycosyltransferase family 4 protein [Streptomyces scopuliridis]
MELVPHFIEIAYLPSHPNYDEKSCTDYQERIKATGGTFSVVPSGTTGLAADAVWGDPGLGEMRNWQIASAALAGRLIDLASRYDVLVAYCHEPVFSFAPIHVALQAEAAGVDITTVYVSHATAFVHEMPLPNPERLMAESLPVHWAKISPTVRLGSISHYMSHHLINEYGANPDTFVPTGNGVDTADHWYRQRSPDEMRELLTRYGVPVDQDLLVTFGRGVPYKRHDMLIRATAETRGSAHPVIMSDTELPDVRKLAARARVDATFITSFDRELMASLVQWPKTRVCSLSAENEPWGLIPMEARLLARDGGALLAAADSGGFSEQVADGIDGFLHTPNSPSQLAQVIDKILGLTENERTRIRRAGAKRVLIEEAWPIKMMESLRATVPGIDAVADAASRELAEGASRGLRKDEQSPE